MPEPDPVDQLRRYSTAAAATVPATELDDVVGRRRAAKPRWALVAVAAVLAVVVVGVAVSALARSDPPTGLSTDPSDLQGPGTWETFPEAPIAGRSGATAVASSDEMLIWGGQDQDVFADGAAYSFDSGSWRMLAPSPLSARTSAVSVWTGREMLIWGGADQASNMLGDGAAYDPATDTWRMLPSPPGDVPLVGAIDGSTGVAWTGRELVLIGGRDEAGAIQNHVAILDPDEGWNTTAPDIAPPPGGGAPRERSAFWTGTEVLVVTVTDLEPVTVDRLGQSAGTWGERIVTEAPGLATDADSAAMIGDRLVIAGHYEPGAIVDINAGTARLLPPSNSSLRFPAVVAGNALTYGDRWLDLVDEEWNDTESVPDPHGEFPVAATDGDRAYYWGDSACGPAASCVGIVDPKIGLVWTPPSPGTGTPSLPDDTIRGGQIVGVAADPTGGGWVMERSGEGSAMSVGRLQGDGTVVVVGELPPAASFSFVGLADGRLAVGVRRCEPAADSSDDCQDTVSELVILDADGQASSSTVLSRRSYDSSPGDAVVLVGQVDSSVWVMTDDSQLVRVTPDGEVAESIPARGQGGICMIGGALYALSVVEGELGPEISPTSDPAHPEAPRVS